MADTVAYALKTPDAEEPWAELGLSADDHRRLTDLLGRRPTVSELVLAAVWWSERCSARSARVELGHFDGLAPRTPRGPLLGVRAGSGVVDLGHDRALTLALGCADQVTGVEPRTGGAVAVGDAARRLLTGGARPVGVLDALRLGPLEADGTASTLPGVVAGVAAEAAGLGLPVIGGQTCFDHAYAGAPLVNTLAVGVLNRAELDGQRTPRTGDRVVLLGGPAGDPVPEFALGASGADDPEAPAGSAALPLTDPFRAAALLEGTRALLAAGVVAGLCDVGHAGLGAAACALALAGSGGLRLELDAASEGPVPPQALLTGGSQDRLLAAVGEGDLDATLAICRRWELPAAVVGEISEDTRLVVDWHGERLVELDPRALAAGAPVLDRDHARPPWMDELTARRAEDLPRAVAGPELAEQVLRLVGSPAAADRGWITDQYDRYVGGDTVAAQPDGAGVLRVEEACGLGVAAAIDGSGRLALLNPYLGAQLALSEAHRNVAVVGAEPLAVAVALSLGVPDNPDVRWQLAELVLGLTDGCRELGLPVVDSQVSFGHRTGGIEILPTPVVGAVGVLDEVADRTPGGFTFEGDVVALLGTTREELSGSAWAGVIHDHLGGMPPLPDLAAERNLAALLVSASRRRMLSAAHDLSAGGLVLAVAEACLRRGRGACLRLPEVPEGDATVALFSESPARALVSLPGAHWDAFVHLCQAHDVPVTRLGEVTAEPTLTVEGLFALPLAALRARWSAPIPDRVEASG